MTPCRHFDGQSSAPRMAFAEVRDGRLRLREATDGDADPFTSTVLCDIEPRDLVFTPPPGAGPARIDLATAGLCELDDHAAAAELFARLGHRSAPMDRLVASTVGVIAVTVAFAAVFAALFNWGIPWAADVVVRRAPGQWEQALGARVLASLDRNNTMRPSTIPIERQERLKARFGALRWPDEDGEAVSVAARAPGPLLFRRFGVPNAFALPGGTIVLTDELANLADDDALMTVLAHEAGHVRHRDVAHQLVRGTLASALAAWYFGDVSSVFGAVAGGLGTMKFSRGAEHEADLYALRTMQGNGIPTQPAAALFRRLQDGPPRPATKSGAPADGVPRAPPPSPRSRFPEYLSTHPSTADRIRLFETPTSDR